MSLSVEQYEKYKKQLAEIQKEITTLEAKESQLVEHLHATYGLTPEEAEKEVIRLEKELPCMEEAFEDAYREFRERYENLS